jgi:flavin reductase (DIM6/NTAB) family NADH-FMN oxidoreductase RutF
MTIDVESFKLGMRRLASGVCLITTIDTDGAARGMTATAVCSVSAAPPTLLCCINRRNATYDAICRSAVFAVNVLSLADRPLADLFATPAAAESKFAAGHWRRDEHGVPLLVSALAAFGCRLDKTVVAGSHEIFFGEIQSIALGAAEATSLLYSHGSYGAFESLVAKSGQDNFWIPSWDDGSR